MVNELEESESGKMVEDRDVDVGVVDRVERAAEVDVGLRSQERELGR